ncbi:MAG: hypothetical protein AAGA42_10435 [Actinomycetota bacterium]
MRSRVGRRTFLIGAGAAAVAACSSSSDDSAAPTGADRTAPLDSPNPSTNRTPGTSAPSPTDPDPTTSATTTESTASDPAEPPALTTDQFAALAVCATLPSSTAGPFPTIEQLDRRDVTEGYPGHPLRLGIRVVDETCQPIPGAEVEIWHADATGDYSSYLDNGTGKDEGEGTTFLRGFQTADANGIVEFQTIYPGWYNGRAVHIHTSARVAGGEVLTAQLYFDEPYTEQVYLDGPYAEFGSPDTTWSTDSLADNPATDGTGITLVAAPTWNGDGTLGLVNMGVRV